MRFASGFLSGVAALLKSLTDFLFPKSKKILVLESTPAAKLVTSLPRALGPDDKNIIALFDYSHPVVKEIIWEIKYGGNKILADKLGDVLFDTVFEELQENQVLEKFGSALLMPMPVSGKRRFERGWNQAEILAEALKLRDKGNVLRYERGQLVKLRHTESQTRTTNKSERLHNLEKSMAVMNPASVAGKFVVLIDDVTTTGATFAEARRALRVAGTKKVLCIAVAH